MSGSLFLRFGSGCKDCYLTSDGAHHWKSIIQLLEATPNADMGYPSVLWPFPNVNQVILRCPDAEQNFRAAEASLEVARCQSMIRGEQCSNELRNLQQITLPERRGILEKHVNATTDVTNPVERSCANAREVSAYDGGVNSFLVEVGSEIPCPFAVLENSWHFGSHRAFFKTLKAQRAATLRFMSLLWKWNLLVQKQWDPSDPSREHGWSGPGQMRAKDVFYVEMVKRFGFAVTEFVEYKSLVLEMASDTFA